MSVAIEVISSCLAACLFEKVATMVRYKFVNVVIFVVFSARWWQLGKANDERCDIDNDITDRGYDGDFFQSSCVNDRLYPSKPQALGNAGICQYEVSYPRTWASDAFPTWLLTLTKTAYRYGSNCASIIIDVIMQQMEFFEEQSSSSAGTYSTLKPPLLERGYWRATNTSTNILACFNTDACPGG